MLIPPIIACLTSALVIVALLRMKRSLPLDLPNSRSLHEAPTPRTGGLAIMLGVGMGWMMAWPVTTPSPMLNLAILLSCLSFIDDFKGLSVAIRLGAQVAAAATLVWLWTDFPGGMLGQTVAAFALVWMTNLYNFMDGADGLAGGMAVIGFGFYAVAAFESGLSPFAAAAASVTGAALGFLWFNFHPARIFMGDAGSVPLGFLAAAMGIWGWRAGVWPLTFPFIVFSTFIFDASATLIKRLLRGDKIWHAHREHYYQRLIRMGVGHSKTALLEYSLMLLCGLSAILTKNATIMTQSVTIIALVVGYGSIAYIIDEAWKKFHMEHLSS